MTTRLHSIEVEDTVAAVLKFQNGAFGVLEASTAIFPGYARRVTVLVLQQRADRFDTSGCGPTYRPSDSFPA